MEQLRLEATFGHCLVQSLCSKQSPRADCSRPCPVGLRISPSVETTQPLQVTCSTIWLPSPWKNASQCSEGTEHSCVSVCFCCFLSCYGTPSQEFGSVFFTPSHQRSLVQSKMGAAGMKGIREDKFVGNSDKQGTDRVTEQHSNVGPSNTADLNALQVTSLDA